MFVRVARHPVSTQPNDCADYRDEQTRPPAHHPTCPANWEEQKRRYVIKSLLRVEGIACAAYQSRFGSSVHMDFPQLHELSDLGLLMANGGDVRLNEAGLAYSDTIGPWLYSDAVTATMEACELS